MSFKRNLTLKIYKGDELTSALINIGIRLAGSPLKETVNFEDVLISASIESIIDEDYRVLGLLTDWLDVHSQIINVDRLSKLVEGIDNEKVKRYWHAISEWKKTDPRFTKLNRLSKVKGRAALLDTGSEYLVKKNGEDERFKNTCLIVPNKTLRHRLIDIETPQKLAKSNLIYRYRLLIGPSYRADIWAQLENNYEQSPTELATITYSSFATAWNTKRDYDIFKGNQFKKITA